MLPFQTIAVRCEACGGEHRASGVDQGLGRASWTVACDETGRTAAVVMPWTGVLLDVDIADALAERLGFVLGDSGHAQQFAQSGMFEVRRGDLDSDD